MLKKHTLIKKLKHIHLIRIIVNEWTGFRSITLLRYMFFAFMAMGTIDNCIRAEKLPSVFRYSVLGYGIKTGN